MNSIEINLLVTPVETLFYGTKNIYRLSDFAYGEWIIFCNGEPKYYLYVFDPMYQEQIDFIKSTKGVDLFLEKKFASMRLNLTMKNKYWLVISKSEPFVKKFTLEKLPNTYFS
jgi:hypothetical protein